MAFLIRTAAVLSICVCVSAILGPGNGTKTTQKTDTYLDAYSKSRVETEKAKKGVIIVTAKGTEKEISNRDDSFGGYDYSPAYSGDSSYNPPSSSGPSASNTYLPPSSNHGTPVKFESEITYNSPPNTYGPPSQNYGPPAQKYGPPSQSYGPPSQNYGPPPQNFGPPPQNYGPPSHNYGPPSHSYGPPAPVYGPPGPAYGPPIQQPLAPVYGPPLKPSFGVPYTAPGLSFLDKLSFKLDILTVAKLMLKFLIFKKIVTMLGVVCMLLVIPKLISFKKDASGASATNDEEYRKLGSSNVAELTSVQQLLDRAISVYGQQQPSCSITCRVRRVIDDIYEFQPYFRVNDTTN